MLQNEESVQSLIDACIQDDDKLYLCVSSPTIKDKPVQIRPWRLSDADFVLDASLPLDPRKTVFVGGVPRPLKAGEDSEDYGDRAIGEGKGRTRRGWAISRHNLCVRRESQKRESALGCMKYLRKYFHINRACIVMFWQDRQVLMNILIIFNNYRIVNDTNWHYATK